jgi:hypothetical protein
VPNQDFTPETGADLPEYHITSADRKLAAVFGDHIHNNDGTHLSGGIADDHLWQRRWRKLVAHSPARYEAPKGKVGKRFISLLADEFQGVTARHWNSERPLVFVAVVLEKQDGVRRAQDIRARLTQRMDLWEQGRIGALVDDTVAQLRTRPSRDSTPRDDESEARAFNARVLSGKIRSAVRTLTNRGSGGVKLPDDICTKTGRPIIDVINEKHPPLRDPGEEIGRPDTPFEPYSTVPLPVPLLVTPDLVEVVASHLSGSAGPGGTDSITLANWLLRYGEASERLREALAALGTELASGNPPWASYRALRACRLVALDKEPGTRPIGIGESYSRLLAKCVLKVVGPDATVACGALNLCAGLKAGIEGAVHAMHEFWEDDPTPDTPSNTMETDSAAASSDDEVVADPDNPRCQVLGDARNGFQELSRKGMLWTVRHRWPGGSRMAFNCYRHAAQLIFRGNGGECTILHSREGVTQGDPLAMILYGLALTPLALNLRDAVPEAIQPWYADDMALDGTAEQVDTLWSMLEEQGPGRGYFAEPEKSIVVCRPEDTAALRRILGHHNFRYCDGHRYLGGFIGSDEIRDEWVGNQVVKWVQGIHDLARVAGRYPQTAYAALTRCLQAEWTYLQRVVPGIGDAFLPIEAAIRDVFLPSLFGEQDPDFLDDFRDLLQLPVRYGGLGIPLSNTNPMPRYDASKAMTQMVVHALKQSQDLDVRLYLDMAARAVTTFRMEKEANADSFYESLLAESAPQVQRRIKRSTECGSWLTAMPSRLNGTELSALEFRDALRLRYGIVPTSMPIACDGCGERFTVGHAMACRKGGLIIHRHDDVAAEWHQLCASALSNSRVTDEPVIPQSRAREVVDGVERWSTPPEIRGDVAAHGFWTRGTTAIFDIRVSDTDARSFRNQDPTKVLERQAKAKKSKYLDSCLEARRHFTPLVFSIDGLRSKETIAASQRLARLLSEKWHRPYSQVVGLIRSRLNIALIRSASRCLRASRDVKARTPSLSWVEGAGIRLFR